jgi:hypothetical protein
MKPGSNKRFPVSRSREDIKVKARFLGGAVKLICYTTGNVYSSKFLASYEQALPLLRLGSGLLSFMYKASGAVSQNGW